MPTDLTTQRVLDDGLLLLYQAERRGKVVDPADSKAILRLKDIVEKASPGPTPDELADALAAVEHIAAGFQPVTVDGIRATDFATIEGGNPFLHFLSCLTFYSLPIGLQRPALAFRIVCWYSILAVVALVLTVLVIVSATGHIANFSLMTTSVQQAKEISDKIKANETQLAANKAEASAEPPPTDARQAVLDDAALQLNREHDELVVEYGKAVGVSILAIHRMETQGDLITRIMRWFGLFAVETVSTSTPGGNSKNTAPDPAQTYVQTVNNLMSMRMGLVALLGFVLPAFAAILGSVAYSLRGIAQEITADTFTGESQIRFRIRMILAPLCGIAVGLLVAGDAKSVIGLAFDELSTDLLKDSVSTGQITTEFTAGFLVGYAIEFFFGLADGAINTIKSRK